MKWIKILHLTSQRLDHFSSCIVLKINSLLTWIRFIVNTMQLLIVQSNIWRNSNEIFRVVQIVQNYDSHNSLFHAVFGKIWPNNRLTPLLGLAPPPEKPWIRHCIVMRDRSHLGYEYRWASARAWFCGRSLEFGASSSDHGYSSVQLWGWLVTVIVFFGRYFIFSKPGQVVLCKKDGRIHVIHSLIKVMKYNICIWMLKLVNKKVLLRERKRHTDRGVSSTPSVVLYQGWRVRIPTGGGGCSSAGGFPIWTWLGYPPSKAGWGTPSSRDGCPPSRGTPCEGVPLAGLPPWLGYPP